MKKLLKLSLAVVAIAALTACGDGEADASEVYVGTWKSKCYSTDSNSGTVYTKRIRTFTKTSATELASSTILDKVFSDAGCNNVLGTWNDNSPTLLKFVLGAKAQFLGANTDTYISTTSTGATFAGYMVVDGAKMSLADAPTGSAAPTGWGIYSPYTKQ
jgi:hypothetical protein